MARRCAKKQYPKPQQAPKPKKIETQRFDDEKTFVTLTVGSDSFERFLVAANTTTLRWLKVNAILATQADTTVQKHLKDKEPEQETLPIEVVTASEVGPAEKTISATSFTDRKTSSITGDSLAAENQPQPATPSAQAPQRTPSIKLKLGGGTPTVATASPSEDVSTSNPSSSKKRKRNPGSVEPDTTTALGAPSSATAKPPTNRTLKLVTKQGPLSTKLNGPLSAVTPSLKLKTRGKIPKRALGVGYDSELETRENDPVICEAFVLRMMPGEDCDYVRDAIAQGTVGVSVLQRGADIRLRFLDTAGRRGVLTVRGKQYAISLVDLPTITEGMKSWDRKNFIKSVDVSQICLVLGRCYTDEEARNYPLPADVNPKNYQYAHGLTAPMRNVRKQRFDRTTRARLDDIEAVERKVNSLLEADSKANSVTWKVLDYDPREQESELEEASDDDDDDDAEAEDDDEGYFPQQVADTDGMEYAVTPQQQQYEDHEIANLEAMFEEGDDDDVPLATSTITAPNGAAAHAHVSFQTSSAGNPTSSTTIPATIEATSSSAPTPAATTELEIEPDTTMSLAEANANASDNEADNDGPEDADADADEDDEDAFDREGNDEKAELLSRIKESEDKIAQQKEQLKRTTNYILRKKIAKKVQELETDVRMMRRAVGVGGAGGRVGGGGAEGEGGGEDGESEEE